MELSICISMERSQTPWHNLLLLIMVVRFLGCHVLVYKDTRGGSCMRRESLGGFLFDTHPLPLPWTLLNVMNSLPCYWMVFVWSVNIFYSRHLILNGNRWSPPWSDRIASIGFRCHMARSLMLNTTIQLPNVETWAPNVHVHIIILITQKLNTDLATMSAARSISDQSVKFNSSHKRWN